MDKNLLKKIVGDAIANANYKRMKNTGKLADEAREELEALKDLQKNIEGMEDSSGTVADEIMIKIEIPVSCIPLLQEVMEKAIAECDKTLEGKRKQKKLIDIQIAMMGGKENW